MQNAELPDRRLAFGVPRSAFRVKRKLIER